MTNTHITPTAAPANPGPAAPRPRALAWFYLIGGFIGLASSFALTFEKLEKLANPGYIPSCSINPIVSCGSVMDSPQAALFGFPNPLIGLMAFPVVITAGAAILARFTAPRWFWLGLQLATTLAVVFIHWLVVQSLYVIGALCPYCMIVWVVTIAMFWYTTLHNLKENHLGGGRSLGVALSRFHSVVLVVWYLVIVVLILQRFWDFWTSV